MRNVLFYIFFGTYRSNTRKQPDFPDEEEEGDEAVEIHIEKELVVEDIEKQQPQKKKNKKNNKRY